jgi:hypothetical protein
MSRAPALSSWAGSPSTTPRSGLPARTGFPSLDGRRRAGILATMGHSHGGTAAAIAAVLVLVAGCVARPPIGPEPTAAASSVSPIMPSATFAGDLPTAAPPVSAVVRGDLVTAPFSGVGNQFVFAATPVGDGFVAVGEDLRFDGPVDGAIWTSPTGAEWSRLDPSASELADADLDFVATTGSTIVALGVPRDGDQAPDGPSRIVWQSSDGGRWTRVSTPPGPFGGVPIGGLTAGRPGYLAWGIRAPGAELFLSPDGKDWQPVVTDAFDGFDVRDVKSYREGFVAVGSDIPPPSTGPGMDPSVAAAWWSSDGRVWQRAATDSGGRLDTVFVGASGLLASGSGGCGRCIGPKSLWGSADGTSWRRMGDDIQGWPAYASDGVRIVRYEWQGGGDVSLSSDGASWQSIGVTGGTSLYGLVLGPHGMLVIDSIARFEPFDENDGGVRFVAFH